ncbi:N/A [soil metagenome]
MSGGFGGIGGGFAGSRAANTPFAGIPSELRERVDAVQADEPDHGEPDAAFSQDVGEGRPLTLRRMLAPRRAGLVGALALVVAEVVTMQAGPLLTQVGIDRGIRDGERGVLTAVALIYLATVVANWGFAWARGAWTARIGEDLLERLRLRVFSHLQRLSLPFYEREPAGRIMTRMTSDVEALTQLFHEGLVQFAVQGFIVVFVTGALFILDPFLAVVTLLGVVPTMAVLTVWFRGRSDAAYRVVRQRIQDVVAHLAENLAGVRVVAAFSRHRHNVVVHRNTVGVYQDANLRTAKLAARYSGASELIGIAGQAVILAVGGWRVVQGQLTIGQLSAFVLYLTQLFAPIQQLVQVYNAYQRGQSGLRELRELLLIGPTVPEYREATALPPIEGEVRFEGVTFAYGHAEPVLQDIDLRIAAGETIALVGPTGSGKSTMVKLLARFYDPSQGRVLLDGHDLRDVRLSSLRRQLGTVPQEAFLFAGSIRDNVAFARPQASDRQVRDACEAVGLTGLLERLPLGLDTPCHERGVSLSAGERQLLALARAFLARPRVLILDEATSNLDLSSEARTERALQVVLRDRTAIVIAHRLSTAMRADRVVVLHDGRIDEVGSHHELVEAEGRYAQLYSTWRIHADGDAA